LLDRLRVSLSGLLARLGSGAARVLPSPTAWTVIGLLLAVLAFLEYAGKDQVWGGLFVLLSAFCDVVDGAVARATGKVSARGAFLDSTLDRVTEVLVYLGIVLGAFLDPFFVALSLSLSLLVSYIRAKADALGLSLAGVGVGERSERLIVIIVASLLGIVGIGVLLVAVLAGLTVVERTYRVSRALGKPREAAPPPPTQDLPKA
jgi:archaetidylinositol phosphate synthase